MREVFRSSYIKCMHWTHKLTHTYTHTHTHTHTHAHMCTHKDATLQGPLLYCKIVSTLYTRAPSGLNSTGPCKTIDHHTAQIKPLHSTGNNTHRNSVELDLPKCSFQYAAHFRVAVCKVLPCYKTSTFTFASRIISSINKVH